MASLGRSSGHAHKIHLLPKWSLQFPRGQYTAASNIYRFMLQSDRQPQIQTLYLGSRCGFERLSGRGAAGLDGLIGRERGEGEAVFGDELDRACA